MIVDDVEKAFEQAMSPFNFFNFIYLLNEKHKADVNDIDFGGLPYF